MTAYRVCHGDGRHVDATYRAMGFKCARCNGTGREDFVRACPNPKCDETDISEGFGRTVEGCVDVGIAVIVLWLGFVFGGWAIAVGAVIAAIIGYFGYTTLKYSHMCNKCGCVW